MINIRFANIKDVETLQILNDEVFIDNAKYDPDLKMDWARSESGKKYFTQLVTRNDTLCIIAEHDSKSIGYLAAGPKEINFRNSKYAEIENMGVIPEYRSKGIGQMLIDKCVEWAKTNSYQKLFVISYAAIIGQ